jgi:hypothetical protein
MTDKTVIAATANILFHGYAGEARAMAAQLALESAQSGATDRARMWSEVAEAVGILMRGENAHTVFGGTVQ